MYIAFGLFVRISEETSRIDVFDFPEFSEGKSDECFLVLGEQSFRL